MTDPRQLILTAAVALVWTMIAYEHRGYGPRREDLRREANLPQPATRSA